MPGTGNLVQALFRGYCYCFANGHIDTVPATLVMYLVID